MRIYYYYYYVHRHPINGCWYQISPPTKFWQCQKIWRSLAVWLPLRRMSNCLRFQDKLWAELMLENYYISHKPRRSCPLTELFYLNTGCAAVCVWVCRAAYTILLKYAGIAAVHILVMMANISAMQLAVTERVWVDHVKLRTSFLARTRFELFLTVVQSDINKNWYPTHMIIMFV